MNDILDTLSNWELILRVNLLLFALFTTVSALLVSNILFMRLADIKENQKIQKEREKLGDFLMQYLFENSDDKEIIRRLKPQTNLQLRTSVEVILEFIDNFKGESLELLRRLFYQWNLQHYVKGKLKSPLWYDVAQAIYIASELKIEEMRFQVEQYTNSSRKEIRQQAIFYLVSMSNDEPLAFLHMVNEPLTIFEQVYIKDCLDNHYSGEIPQFSQFLGHSLLSVQVFGIKMIAEYNQFDATDDILPFLESEEEELRIEAICSLSKLEYPELKEIILKSIASENGKVRSQFLKELKRKCTISEFQKVHENIPENDYKNRVLHFKLANTLKKEMELYV
ncbi:hypothetical protein [Salinimicrobium sp. GXAS 041]|uniref:hypothetical protein n=1 Tax=Salinimicrobium sp. GXAS 041 TaxID=3400806 RepID=UPI003C773050